MTKQLVLTMAAGAFLAGGVHAQSRPKPDDPAAPVAPTAHVSAFEGYRAFRDEPVAPWRDVNNTVRDVGGHAGVLRAEQDVAPPEQATGQAGAGRAPMRPNEAKEEK